MLDDTQHDHSDQTAESNIAYICEQARLHGAAPGPGEYDPREIWERETILDAAGEAFETLASAIGQVGFQVADETDSILWGFVNLFDNQVRRIDRNIDRHMPGLQDMQREQDGTEIKSHELEMLTHRVQNLTGRRDALEQVRDMAALLYLDTTGKMWRPKSGSHTSMTGAITSSVIDARDFVRARKDRETQANLPDGTLVAITGGKEGDPDAVFQCLDSAYCKYPDMVLVHGGGPGIEHFAARWAESKHVHQVVCKPNWTDHGRAAPFRRNDQLLELMPKGLIAFPGSGITDNLVDKATKIGIPVFKVAV